MKKLITLLLVVIVFAGCHGTGGLDNTKDEGVGVFKLRCEYLKCPLGIDVPSPRLSWVIESGKRGIKQSAYQLLVAGSKKKLVADEGDLWDTGKVESGQSVHLAYAGRKLESYDKCWWKVRVWCSDGSISSWSEPGYFSMGILDESQWGGQWLGYTKEYERDKAKRVMTYDGSRWVWYPEKDFSGKKPFERRYFRYAFDVAEGTKIKWAGLILTGDDDFTAYVNGKEVIRGNGSEVDLNEEAEVFEVTELLASGKNILAFEASNVYRRGVGVASKLVIEIAGGEKIVIVTDESCKAAKESAADWNQIGFDDSGWAKVKVLGEAGNKESRHIPGWLQKAPSPIFRKEFEVQKKVKSAYVYICGLGYYELRLNGDKVGDHVLDPAFTRYDRRSLYVTYDVTEEIQKGKNALGVMLGNGWYNMHTRGIWNFDKSPWRGQPRMLLQLRIEYNDGTIETIVSDQSWRANTGPVVYDGIRSGEVYDARLEEDGWDEADFDDSRWSEPEIVTGPGGKLRAQMLPAIKVIDEIQPVWQSEPAAGVFIFDMGQNFAGWVKLKVRGPAGRKITIKYGERVTAAGRIDQASNSRYVFQGPFHTNVYTLKGDGLEQWEPRFAYYGFQYVEVSGLGEGVVLEEIAGRVLHSSFEKTGSFECSNELINKIQHATVWGYKSNFFGYPTDCPHREKNGWMGDAHLLFSAGMYNFDNAASYFKWMEDHRDEQRQSGEMPGIVPTGGWGYKRFNCTNEVSARVLIPWYMYQHLGDLRVLEENYESMKKYVDFLESVTKGHIHAYHSLGDWVYYKTQTPDEVTGTSFYYADTLIIARAAEILGKQADAQQYYKRAEEIRKAFNKEFYKGDGIYANGSQTSLVCSVHFGFVDSDNKERVIEKLVADIDSKGGHLDAGMYGVAYMFDVLTDNGRADVAWQVATQLTQPGFGDWIMQGATTLWEDWTDTEGSKNNAMTGNISGWFYRALAGINLDENQVGFKHIIIRPRVVGDIKWVKAKTESMYGTIKSSWKIDAGGIKLDVTIPANTTATVYVPTKDVKSVIESGSEAGKSEGVKFLRYEQGAAVYRVGSGNYSFEAKV